MENKNIYDEVPYPSLPYAQSHPNRLATVAALLGLESAPVTRCRVLELGCAAGGNLIPMAHDLPNSRFMGIDNSAQQIKQAQQLVKGLGLDNVNFKHLDILQAGPGLGSFDYIIAHGVYSWTPPPVRDAVLRICQQNLAANGFRPVTNLRHERVTLNDFQRQVFPYLNGHYTLNMLADVLVERVKAGELRLENRGEPITKESRVENLLVNLLTPTMPQLASKALLVQ